MKPQVGDYIVTENIHGKREGWVYKIRNDNEYSYGGNKDQFGKITDKSVTAWSYVAGPEEIVLCYNKETNPEYFL